MDQSSQRSNLSQILGHPLRLSIYELIREGAKTAPELAEILNINRLNLYHHLKQMEIGGVITSNYGENRTKRYAISDETPSQSIQTDSKTTTTQTIIINEPKTGIQKSKYNSYLRELSEEQGRVIPDDHSIIQVHIFTQTRSISDEKAQKLSQVKVKRSQKK